MLAILYTTVYKDIVFVIGYKVYNVTKFNLCLYHICQFRWSYLEVHTSSSYPDDIQSLAAGMVEGYLTADFILMHWKNTLAYFCEQKKEICDKLNNFLYKNSIFLTSQIESNNLDSYWYQVSSCRFIMDYASQHNHFHHHHQHYHQH